MEADVLTTPRITYGDLLAMGYLLGEFNHDAGAALRFCEENSVERRSHYNRIPRRWVKPNAKV